MKGLNLINLCLHIENENKSFTKKNVYTKNQTVQIPTNKRTAENKNF